MLLVMDYALRVIVLRQISCVRKRKRERCLDNVPGVSECYQVQLGLRGPPSLAGSRRESKHTEAWDSLGKMEWRPQQVPEAKVRGLYDSL